MILDPPTLEPLGTGARRQNVSKTAAESCGAARSRAEIETVPSSYTLERIDELACVAAHLVNYRFDNSSPVHPATHLSIVIMYETTNVENLSARDLHRGVESQESA